MKIELQTEIELDEVELRNAVRNYLVSTGLEGIPADASIKLTSPSTGEDMTGLMVEFKSNT